MNEHQKHPIEHEPKLKQPEYEVEKAVEASAEKVEHESHDHSIDKLQKSIHEQALSSKEVTIGEHRHDNPTPILGMQRELKAEAYKRTLQKTRSHLNTTEKAFSKVIHQPIVESISNISSKSIARPSGLLGSGLAALLGSGVVLYMSKYYGFRYNFIVFLLLSVLGFAIGLIVELFIGLIRRA